MLYIQEHILNYIHNAVILSNIEQGFILGSKFRLNQLDCCIEIPAIQTSLNFYRPDTNIASEIINQWNDEGICFCGFLHSHVVCKNDLSEADQAFARALYKTYNLPLIWFGLAVAVNNTCSIYFYCVQENEDGSIQISPITYDTVS